MARKSNAPSLFDLDDASVAVAEDPAVVARREKYRARLAEKLKDPEFRKIEGFPIGTDEAILALSDPPYYTACPNPFLDEWLAEHGTRYDAATDGYHREPFAADVSEGKNHPIYNAHSYHTKVPHRAIMRYILHYTQPGDVVYDGFCGTGMTGVAARLCGDKAEVESLGYHVDKGGGVWEPEAWAARQAIDKVHRNPSPHLTDPQPFSKLGTRKAVLNDLSPAASFIAHNYNTHVDVSAFEAEAKRLLDNVEAECGWMYATLHDCSDAEIEQWRDEIGKCQTPDEAREAVAAIPAAKLGRINFTVWSEVFTCPQCGGDVVFVTEALDRETDSVRKSFPCPHCRVSLTKDDLEHSFESKADSATGTPWQRIRFIPAFIDYSVAGGRRRQKEPDTVDFALAERAQLMPLPPEVPTNEFPISRMYHGSRLAPKGFSNIHHVFLPRAAQSLAALWRFASRCPDRRLRDVLLFFVEQAIWGLSVMNRYSPTHFSQVNRALNGVYYVPSQHSECSPSYVLGGKLSRLVTAFRDWPDSGWTGCLVGAGSATALDLLDDSIDYAFVDPPFGENIYYADLNLVVESWHHLRTNEGAEAIVDRAKGRDLGEYQRMMRRSLAPLFRALKPGRWLTVEFSNSQTAVWNSIQHAIESAGFIVADVRVLDKQGGSFRQVTADSAVKQDLVLSCYKPTSAFERSFSAHVGQPTAVREFVEQHLTMLPVTPITKAHELERLAERTTSILYDRVIAYHLVRGAQVPISSSDFALLLNEHFVQRDGMWFLPGQEVRYDLCKLRGVEVEQQVLFVSDERSAVSWLRSEVASKTQNLGELTPKFMQATKEWPAHEPRPELRELLRDWFIEIDGRWANPNPDDEKHVEALRKKSLLRLFATYAAGKGKLKEFRREALIEAFRYCWNSGQEAVFVSVCQRIPDKLLRDDAQLSEAYDLAADRVASRPLPPQQQEFEWD
jgi:hypothetical protein